MGYLRPRMLAFRMLGLVGANAALHAPTPVDSATRLTPLGASTTRLGGTRLDRRAAVLAAAGCCSLAVPTPFAHAALEPLCAEEVAINGGYLTRCMDDARRVFEWPAVGSISIEQGVAGFGQTGQVVWNAGALLAEHMATRLGPSFFGGKRVLELGCGTGLPGIVAARLGASKLVLTDGTKEVIARAELNAAANLKGMPVAVSSMQLNWGEVTGKELGTFDVLLASDVLYQAAGWRPFAQTAGELLAPNGVVLVAEAGHQTSPADDTLRGFRVVAEGCGLACEDPETLAQQGESGYNAQLMRVWGRS
jgi:predicted nicotinamide N-methyase